jgi:Zn-dependent M32 family carboxypeptidase
MTLFSSSPSITVQIPKDKTPEDLYRAVNIIKVPSMIRVEADEVGVFFLFLFFFSPFFIFSMNELL